MKSILSVEINKRGPAQEIAVVIDDCTSERLESLVKELAALDPKRQLIWRITAMATSFDTLVTVSRPLAVLVFKAIKNASRGLVQTGSGSWVSIPESEK